MSTKPPATPGYTGMLALTVASMAFGVLLMALELNEYGWDPKPKPSQPVALTPISRAALDDVTPPAYAAAPAQAPAGVAAAPAPVAAPAALPVKLTNLPVAVATDVRKPEIAPQPRPATTVSDGPIPSPFKLPVPVVPTTDPAMPTPSPLKLPK
jgi:translation initiation factor IF-2